MQLTHGSIEQSLSSEQIGFGDNKFNYSGYDLKWTPSDLPFSMQSAETAWWQGKMEKLDVPEDIQYAFFNPNKATAYYADDSVIDVYHSTLAPGGYVSGSVGWNEGKGVGRDPRVDQLPGIHETVKHPVYDSDRKRMTDSSGDLIDFMDWSLEMVIIDLNDNHDWTREQVADWLETLDIDIRFRGEDSDEHSRPQGTGVV
jgi:hypothetical protein